ncbi:hypothetical protein T05_13667 [Trichinella murrelli]|uniref:Uncharacterized protein n=1 Tax=Trichinella murrelli TaxID=144512 RepID=A0A0V0UD36_9BILA|nr:hypothetical protein T05_13667 [Trichinella murrelli]
MCEGGRLASSEDGHDGRFEIKREPAPNERLGIGCALVTPNSWEAEANVDEKTRPNERERTSTQWRLMNWRGPGGRSAGPTPAGRYTRSVLSQSTNPHVPLVSTVRKRSHSVFAAEESSLTFQLKKFYF